jgi:hypothetical protein
MENVNRETPALLWGGNMACSRSVSCVLTLVRYVRKLRQHLVLPFEEPRHGLHVELSFNMTIQSQQCVH